MMGVSGRRFLDPVVFFKLQLIMFFKGIRSEHQLMRLAADRLSLRLYLGYDLHETSRITPAAHVSAKVKPQNQRL